MTRDRMSAAEHWSNTAKPRALIQLAGLSHGLGPFAAANRARVFATAWLEWQVLGNALYKPWISGAEVEAARKRGEILEACWDEPGEDRRNESESEKGTEKGFKEFEKLGLRRDGTKK